MITQLRLSPRAQEFTCRVSVDFEPGINLVVGPNGSGKSHVVRALHYAAEKGRKAKNLSVKGNTTTRFFDSENMNPHVMNVDMAMDSAASMGLWFGSRSKSHGQCLAPILTRGLHGQILHCRERLEHRHMTVLLDEPESGLDQAALHEFARVVKKWSRKVQFIIATHSVWLWREFHDANFIVLGPDGQYVQKVLGAWHDALFTGANLGQHPS